MADMSDAHYIENKATIKALSDKMDIIIKNMEEHIEEMHKSMNEQFSKLDKKIDGVSEDLQQLRDELPHTIDERIRSNTSNNIVNLVKWLVITVGGSVFITVMTRFVTQFIGI